MEMNETHQEIVKALEYLIPFNNDKELEQLIKELKLKENHIITVE